MKIFGGKIIMVLIIEVTQSFVDSVLITQQLLKIGNMVDDLFTGFKKFPFYLSGEVDPFEKPPAAD